jgi:hypothetical protein
MESSLQHQPDSAVESEPSYHPLFPCTNTTASIILKSADGTCFCVPVITLRSTSGFFRDMVTLPQNDNSSAAEEITVNEPEKVLDPLLRMISGFPIQKWQDLEGIEAVLRAAEKYDMPGPITIIRSAITSPFVLEHPLWLYAIATQFDWEEEAKLASNLSLRLSIHDDSYDGILERMSSRALRKLYTLHRTRSKQFEALLDGASFSDWNKTSCFLCHRTFDSRFWYVLKGDFVTEMERRPLGDTLMEMKITGWSRAQSATDIKCQACGATRYQGPSSLLLKVGAALLQLPSTI